MRAQRVGDGRVARTCALLLVAGGFVALAGALTPMPSRIWLGYDTTTLQLVRANRNRWRWANSLFLVGSLSMALGFTQYVRRVRPVQPPWLATSTLVVFLTGTGLWVLELLFRLTAMVRAAETLERTGTVPSYFGALSQWAWRSFLAFMVSSNVALGAYGLALIQAGSRGLGRLTALASGGTLVSLWLFGDSLPVLVHMVAATLGVDLLRRRP
ncbi:MAG: hypothetical protein ACYC4L_12075 [Chloroflexota bacterium]